MRVRAGVRPWGGGAMAIPRGISCDRCTALIAAAFLVAGRVLLLRLPHALPVARCRQSSWLPRGGFSARIDSVLRTSCAVVYADVMRDGNRSKVRPHAAAVAAAAS